MRCGPTTRRAVCSTSALMSNKLQAYTELGHICDPTYATPELGWEVTERIVSTLADRIASERGDAA